MPLGTCGASGGYLDGWLVPPREQNKCMGLWYFTHASVHTLLRTAGFILLCCLFTATTGEIYRWQDHPDRDALNSPLMNLTWEFQSRDVAPMEGLTVDSFPYVSFETKLGILARQMQRHRSEFAPNPVWCAIQQTLANRFSVGASA